MIEYIKGELVELTPTDAIVECSGIGYHCLISLQTYSALEGQTSVCVYIHHLIKEDDEQYFGFAGKDERELFRSLISVSGVGASIARMMLSSMSSDEIRNAILSEDLNKIKSIKGIGLKTAQRLILELKDKLIKGEGQSTTLFTGKIDNALADEAVSALIMLGFAKPNCQKVVSSLLQEDPKMTIETIIKLALKRL